MICYFMCFVKITNLLNLSCMFLTISFSVDLFTTEVIVSVLFFSYNVLYLFDCGWS